MILRKLAVGAVAAMALTACGDDGERSADPEPSVTSSTSSTTSTTSTTTTTTAPATLPPAPETTVAPAPARPATSPAPPPPPAPVTEALPPMPPYQSAVAAVDPARTSHSWRPGCPVALEDLRLVTVRHWNDAGQIATGELVVHADAAEAIAAVFGDLYAQRFPIARMELVDVYGGDDGASMRANNTSAFNCRNVAGTDTWSQHSYGRAVDVNPLVNPWVRGGSVDPPEGREYANRSNRVPGGIYAGDEVVAAFARIGWQWGGNWSGTKDYQHFSANGR